MDNSNYGILEMKSICLEVIQLSYTLDNRKVNVNV